MLGRSAAVAAAQAMQRWATIKRGLNLIICPDNVTEGKRLGMNGLRVACAVPAVTLAKRLEGRANHSRGTETLAGRLIHLVWNASLATTRFTRSRKP